MEPAATMSASPVSTLGRESAEVRKRRLAAARRRATALLAGVTLVFIAVTVAGVHGTFLSYVHARNLETWSPWSYGWLTSAMTDPTRPTALAVLKVYPSAQAMAQADPAALSKLLHEHCPSHYGRQTAEELVRLATGSVSSGLAIAARSSSLRILCDQLQHTQSHLKQLQEEIERLVNQDPKAKGVLSITELGPLTVAVVRAELGDLDRFTRMDQVVAYTGLDLRVNESGKWKGQTKLSKRGSGRLRRSLYLAALRSIRLPDSPFGFYYHRLVDRGMKKGMAVVAVMRKLLIVAAHLILTEQVYEPGKVAAK